MKNKYMRLKAMLLAGFFAVTSTGFTGCGSNKYDGNELVISQSVQNLEKKIFDVGEHIISVPIKNPTSEIKQYNYHEGYKVVGIATANYAYNFGGACLIYENEYPVECYSSITDKSGNHIYETFGNPIDFYVDKTNKTSYTKDFNIGEHIISIPIKNPTSKAKQYEYYEGYEVVGIATANYGYNFGGACILYVNNQPVTCTLTEIKNNQELYLTFGVPVEKEKTKTLN